MARHAVIFCKRPGSSDRRRDHRSPSARPPPVRKSRKPWKHRKCRRPTAAFNPFTIHSVYRGGHLDTTAAAFPLLIDFGIFKSGWIPIGEAEDGPVVSLGPGTPEDGSHFHNSAQVRFFICDSLRIGNEWHKTGDIRIQ